MIHAVIIDDEMNGVKSLELLLTKFIPDVKVVATCTDARDGIEIINNYRPDVVFLDINMPALNGFDLIEKLTFREFHLVFSTAYQEYALRALKLNATDYLLKPIDIEELKATIERIRTNIEDKKRWPDMYATLKEMAEIRNMRIPLAAKGNITYVTADQVLYIEANSNQSVVTLAGGEQENVSSSLKDYEAQLCKPGQQFMRIHNSFIVNLHYVTRYIREDGGYVVMQGKKSIPISKHKKDEFLAYIDLAKEGT
jgi:two-component system LytT family response regulator